MRVIIIVILFLVQINASCQVNKGSIIRTTNEAYFGIADENYCAIKYSVENVGKDKLVLWIADNKLDTELKKYLFKKQGDFNLLNLITERLLDEDNQIIFKSFIKVLNKNEHFEIVVMIKDPNKQKIERSKNFIDEYIKVESIEQLDNFVNSQEFENLFFKKDFIVLPYTQLE